MKAPQPKRAKPSSFAPILDRELATSHVKAHFADYAKVLEHLTDFGTNLIPRCFQTSQRERADVILLGVLTKQAVAMLDAGHLLINSGAVAPALLQLRAMFEVSVYVSWIMRRDTKRRARAYYVANLRQRRKWAQRALQGTPEAKAYRQDLAELSDLSYLSERQDKAAAEFESVETHLRRAALRQMNAAFDRRRRGRFDPDWYSVLFPKKKRPSLLTLAKQVDRRAEYRLIYEQGSEAMHSSRMDPHIRMATGSITFRPLRDLTDLPHVAQLFIHQAVGLFHAVLARYRPAELESFAKKYAAEWRPVFLAERVVRYNYGDPTTTRAGDEHEGS